MAGRLVKPAFGIRYPEISERTRLKIAFLACRSYPDFEFEDVTCERKKMPTPIFLFIKQSL